MAADAGIKRVVVPRGGLPPVNIVNDPKSGSQRMVYFFRYRVVSEDKNRASHWSPNYRVVLPPLSSEDTSQISKATTRIGNVRTTVWSLPPKLSNLTQFDIYYRYNNNVDWVFAGTVSSTTFSNPAPDTVSTYEIAVQIPTDPKIRFSGATLFTDTSI